MYKIYFKGDKVKIPGSLLYYPGKSRHIWPEDNTEITFSISGSTLNYSISNLSDRTQYLYDNDKLGLGVFVEENPSWISKEWKSTLSKQRDGTRHCLKAIRINSLSGTVDLNTISGYEWYGCLSKSCYYIFKFSASYREPYVSEGTERVALGVGRLYDVDIDFFATTTFRPHKMSEYVTMNVENKM